MATKTIAWETGGGYITLTYTGTGEGPVSVRSDANELYEERQQTVRIVTTAGSPEKAVELLVKQKGKSYPVGTEFDFDYTGSVQEITLQQGKYKLQCWGAQGGNVSGSYTAAGSKGGYSEGVLTVTKPTTIYVFVGGKGTDSSTSSTSGTANGGWNGGGSAARYASYNSGDTNGYSWPRPGGGATDMCLITSSMTYSSGRTNRDSASLLSRFIVAGGGAGASARKSEITEEIEVEEYEVIQWWYGNTNTFVATGIYQYYTEIKPESGKQHKVEIETDGDAYLWNIAHIPVGGGTMEYIKSNTFISDGGRYFLDIRSSVSGTKVIWRLHALKMTTKPSISITSSVSSSSQQGGGTSGRGQYPGTQSSAGSGGGFGVGGNQTTTNYRYVSGAGGGGWYGGGKGYSDTDTDAINDSGGGSGFVNTAANASYRPSGYTGLQLDSGSTKDGSVSFPSVSGGTETGHSGNGYAKITVLEN